jgi:sialate O-acetylesterase
MDKKIFGFRWKKMQQILAAGVVFLFFRGWAAERITESKVQPAAVFGSGMVFQQGEPIRVWGTAASGQSVRVRLGEDLRDTTANEQGGWLVEFPSRKASFDPLTLQINEFRYEDILVGEVWLCSGQSNMALSMQHIQNKESYLADAENPFLRIAANDAVRDASGNQKGCWPEESLARCSPSAFFRVRWSSSTRQAAEKCSAVAWLMGSELQKKLGVPVGIVVVSSGGSALNNWIPPDALKAHPLTASLFDKDWLTNEDVRSQHRIQAVTAFQSVMGDCRPSVTGNRVINTGAPWLAGQMPYRWYREPGFLFEAGIAPLRYLSFRGVLWYQGESDAESEKQVERAKSLFPMLVNSWRGFFGKKLPFVCIQLPGWGKGLSWPQFRELQRGMEKEIPGISVVVTIDTGDEENVHPRDKGMVGMRSAHVVLRDIYGRKELPAFPQVSGVRRSGSSLIITLTECGGGLKPVAGVVTGFEVAGHSGIYSRAEACITAPDTVEIRSPVADPVAVRYGWQPFPSPPLQLFNSAGLPLGPFQLKIE